MLKDGGSIPRDTLQSQDGINLGDIHFCPLLCTLHMPCLSFGGLHTLLSEGTFAPQQSDMPPKLGGMTAILLVFQADSKHKNIINVYVGLVVRQVDSRLYSPSQIHDFIHDIEGNLQVVHNAVNAGGNPSKRCTYCLFVDNLSGLCPSPWTLPIAWCTPPVTSKASNPIILTLVTVPQGHACIIVYATLPCSSVMMIPNSVLNMLGVTSSFLWGAVQ